MPLYAVSLLNNQGRSLASCEIEAPGWGQALQQGFALLSRQLTGADMMKIDGTLVRRLEHCETDRIETDAQKHRTLPR